MLQVLGKVLQCLRHFFQGLGIIAGQSNLFPQFGGGMGAFSSLKQQVAVPFLLPDGSVTAVC